MPDANGSTVLVVDDDPQVLELFERILQADYDVHVAESGVVALDVIDENTDVCLIDRRMPGLTGGELVQQLREAGFDQPVAMVTAVEPDIDVFDMGFDDYVVKPVSAADLRKVVESLVLRERYDDTLRDYFALASKVSALQASKSTDELAAAPEYTRAVDELNEIKQAAKDSLEATMDAGTLEELFWETFLERQSLGAAESG